MTALLFRPAGPADLEAFARFAAVSGGGMTNLPDDRDALIARLERAESAFARDGAPPENELYMFVLEIDGEPAGTGVLFSRVGEPFGFVNFKITTLVHASPSIGKRARCDLLVLNHDYTDASEVGGLFLDPARRGGGVGRFLSRVRYLFMAQSPERFGDRVIAELRGWQEPDGRQPFWDAVGRRFFDMEFAEADLLNARLGNRFIADLMPQHPVYVAMLPDDARACIARPHTTGEAAYRMHLEEGFRFQNYVDIFDGGPLVSARPGDIRAVAESRELRVSDAAPADDAPEAMIAAGRGGAFRATRARVEERGGEARLGEAARRLIDVTAGDAVRIV